MSSPAASKHPPAVDDGKAGRKRKSAENDEAAAGSRLRRITRWVLMAIAVLALIPGVLVPIYTVLRPISTLMIATRIVDGPIRRDWARFDDIAKVAVISVMVSEDSRFCDHHGVDWGALNEVLDDPDGPSRGASTIAMQTARNLFLWTSPSYVRKGLEIPIALYADAIWSKRRMMEIYLNIAEWGAGIFGIEAAAQHYFGRAAKDLTANQSALLAVTLPNPKVRNPAKPSRQMQSLARTVAARARIAGPYVKCLYP
ncbi:MAG: transglycosylase domain-containing protein [Bauldia sp.]|nr:transglycosylase domain-containing protein [Bauldia sp.]